MITSRYLSHGIVAVTACLIGSTCGYGFATVQRASAQTSPPTVVTAPAVPSTNVVPTSASAFNVTVAVAGPNVKPAAPTPAPVRVRRPASEALKLPMNPDSLVSKLESFRLDIPCGWPIVLVRALDEESVWYVQDECELADGSLFVCTAVFGNATTSSGTQFEVTAIIAKDAEQARQFAPGTILRELPADMTSAPVTHVVRR